MTLTPEPFRPNAETVEAARRGETESFDSIEALVADLLGEDERDVS